MHSTTLAKVNSIDTNLFADLEIQHKLYTELGGNTPKKVFCKAIKNIKKHMAQSLGKMTDHAHTIYDALSKQLGTGIDLETLMKNFSVRTVEVIKLQLKAFGDHFIHAADAQFNYDIVQVESDSDEEDKHEDDEDDDDQGDKDDDNNDDDDQDGAPLGKPDDKNDGDNDDVVIDTVNLKDIAAFSRPFTSLHEYERPPTPYLVADATKKGEVSVNVATSSSAAAASSSYVDKSKQPMVTRMSLRMTFQTSQSLIFSLESMTLKMSSLRNR